MITHAARLQPVADELEELARRQVERDVRLAVGVHEDHVVARVGPAQERARVLGGGACRRGLFMPK